MYRVQLHIMCKLPLPTYKILHVCVSMLFFFFFWMSLMIGSSWVRPVQMWTNTFFVEGTSQSVKQSGCVHAIHFQQTGYIILSFNQLSDNIQFNCLRRINPYQTKMTGSSLDGEVNLQIPKLQCQKTPLSKREASFGDMARQQQTFLWRSCRTLFETDWEGTSWKHEL